MDKTTLASMIHSALEYGDFTLSSGKKSKHYIDLRKITMSAKGQKLIGSLLWDIISQYEIDVIGGPAMAAIPVISSILASPHCVCDGFYVRDQAKVHGLGRNIEGILPKESNVAIIDDVVTTGTSLVKTIEMLVERKCTIVIASCVLDRQEGAKELFDQMDVPFVPLFTLEEIIGIKP